MGIDLYICNNCGKPYNMYDMARCKFKDCENEECNHTKEENETGLICGIYHYSSDYCINCGCVICKKNEKVIQVNN